MAKIAILGEGATEKERSNNKGKLFEALTKEILEGFGFKVTNITRVNYAGMEIDVEGNRLPDNTPFIGECKAWETQVPAEPLRDFFGKYTARWFKDKRLQGIFITLSNIGSGARGFYNENIKDNREINFSLIEEPAILEQIYRSNKTIAEEVLHSVVTQVTKDNFGDAQLLYTKRDFFWIQYIIEPGETLPTKVALVDSKGNFILDPGSVQYIENLYKPLETYEIINKGAKRVKTDSLKDEQIIVKIKGSSSCFEYQFPASPEFFFGRELSIKECLNVVSDITLGKTSSKGILVLANSGWGKSSLILKISENLKKEGILLIPIDSRTAINQEFCLSAVDYAIKEAIENKYLNGKHNDFEIGGFTSLSKTLQKVGVELAKLNKALLVFFDQFENIFFQRDTLEKIYNLVAVLSECPSNILVGFSWKSDLIGMTEDFPYQLRDGIRNQCGVIELPLFGEVEITAMLKAVERELKISLKQKLSQLIREYSQGYPWSLKKVCAHVIRQCKKGVSQVDLINNMLNIKELFEQDLAELYPEEKDALCSIAKRAPLSLSEIPEGYSPKLLRSLVDKRLVVQIGHKFDIYWDIFKDYLNTGVLPVEESYILRLTPGSVLKALFRIREKKSLNVNTAYVDLKYKGQKTVYNVIRELRVLDLIKYQGDEITLNVNPADNEKQFDLIVKGHIKAKLGRHKIIARLLITLEAEKNKQLPLESYAKLIEEGYPYIKADHRTWLLYAKNFSTWADCADLVIYDNKKKTVGIYDPTSEVRTKKSLFDFIQKASNIATFVPSIQYDPIEKAIISIGDVIRDKRGKMTTLPTTVSSWKKALRDAMVLKLLVVEEDKIRLLPEGVLFYEKPQERRQIFTRVVSNLDIYKNFSEIFKKGKGKLKVKQLSERLNKKLKVGWSKQTALTVTKILINWTKVTGLYDSVKAS
ncbi:MAG: restriction endonuclease [bacterium]